MHRGGAWILDDNVESPEIHAAASLAVLPDFNSGKLTLSLPDVSCSAVQARAGLSTACFRGARGSKYQGGEGFVPCPTITIIAAFAPLYLSRFFARLARCCCGAAPICGDRSVSKRHRR